MPITKATASSIAPAAKGDLVVGSATNDAAVLAVGNSGETLVADSSATTGLRYQEPKAGNPVINSAYQIWQRGTSVAGAGGGAYTADRWMLYAGGQGTVSRQTTSDTTNLANVQYCARVQRNNASSDTTVIPFGQSFESINSIPFAGKTVTLSFYARKGANYSSASDALSVTLATGTGTDQNFLSAGYTGSATPISQTATLTTTWQRFSYSAALSSSLTELAIRFQFTPVGTAGAADYFEVTGVQLEVGSVATPFKTQGVTLAGELAACQRYFQRRINSVATAEETVGVAQNYSTTQAFGSLNWINTMRVAPTVSVSAATDYAIRNATAGVVTLTAFTFDRISTNQCRFNTTVASGQVAGNAGLVAAIFANSATLDASAEL